MLMVVLVFILNLPCLAQDDDGMIRQVEDRPVELNHGLTPELVEDSLRAKLTHPVAKDFIERYPIFLRFVGQWYAGPEQAFDHFVKIIEQKEKLKTYGFTALAIFLISQILGAFPPKKGLVVRLFYKLFLSVLTFFVFVGAFGYVFQTEMTSTFIVAKRVFIKEKSFF